MYTETGALFGLACDLIVTYAGTVANDPLPGMHQMVALLGQYFQIRDDYQNLVSADVRESRAKFTPYLIIS